MKYGCCLNMIAAAPGGIGAEHLSALKKSGFDYAELPLAEMMALSGADFDSLRSELRRVGIPCETCNNFFPKTIRLTGAEANQDQILTYAASALDRAASLGVSVVVFGSGGAKNVPAGYPLEKGYAQVVELLKKIGPMAQARAITIAIEPLRSPECNLINTFREGCRLADDVRHPAVRVLVDFFHMTEEHESPEAVRELGPGHLAHVHFANPIGRVYPVDPQEADYLPFMRALKSIPYDARISCEAYTNCFEESAPKALSCFRSLDALSASGHHD